jgi:hypothetical protein
LPDDNVWAIATDPDGSHWFGTEGGVAHLFGTTWTVYNASNSALPACRVMGIATDPDGSHWFATDGGGVAHFDGTNWTVYDAYNSGLPADNVYAITCDPDGSHWFGTVMGSGVAHFDGTTWTIYDESNSALPNGSVQAIAADLEGSHWFGSEFGGVAVLWNKPLYPIENNPQWLDDHTYRGTYDITSLVERGEYRVHVSGAVGTDGMEIAPTVGYPFTVDYAGAIGDTSPPPVPAVEACASTTVGTLSASWSAYDPDSVITLYSYAIGTTPGGGEVVNWTNTMATSFTRTGLGLIAGHTYYISVKARNEGGLWSEAGTPAGLVAGSGTCTTNNTAPVADAGIDQNVTVNALVTLDGSGSYDPDGHLLSAYSWQQTGGPTVILNGSTTDHPTFTAPAEPATLIFALTVTDEYGLPDPTPDEVMVTVSSSDNAPPVADAGTDQNVAVNALVTLDGSGSYDPDGHLPLSYSWQQTGGTAVVLNGSTTDHPTFTAPAVPSVLAFALSVTDAFGLSDLTPDQVKVTVSLSGKWLVHLPVVMRNW